MMKSGTGGSAFTWHPSTSPHLASHGVSNQECCCICLTALVISATVIASPLHICTCSGRKRYHPWGEQLSALEHGLPAFHSAPGCLLFTFPWRHSLGCSLLWNLPNSYLLLPQRASLIPSIASVPWVLTVRYSCLSLSAAPPKLWALSRQKPSLVQHCSSSIWLSDLPLFDEAGTWPQITDNSILLNLFIKHHWESFIYRDDAD